MCEQGAALQKYNQELVKSIENLKRKRCELLASIEKQIQDRERLECALKDIQEKLNCTNDNLEAKYETKANYDKIIEETETVYMKILESSQVLLAKIRQEASALEQKSLC